MQRLSERNSKEMKGEVKTNQEYLNFIKKDHRTAMREKIKEEEEGPALMNRNSSVFVLRDSRKECKLEKLAFSMSKHTYQLKNKANPQDTQYINLQMINEVVAKKNREIEAVMSKEKQNMSEVVYNYSKFRSMQSQYQRIDRVKKKMQKGNKDLPKNWLKFPELNKSNQGIFTIDYDPDGKKLARINLGQLELALQKQGAESFVHDKSLSKQLKAIFPENQLQKKSEIHLLKHRKQNNQFGIDVRAINNNKFLWQQARSDNGSKIRKDVYQLTSDLEKKEHFKLLKEEDLLAENAKSEIMISKSESEHLNTQNIEFKMVSSKDIFSNNSFVSCKYKDTSRFQQLNNIEIDSEAMALPELQSKEQEQSERGREKVSESVLKRETNRKNLAILYEKEITVYDQKMASFRQFLFMMNLAHKKYDQLLLGDSGSIKNQQKYRYYIGLGNNSLLVKSLMKRRFWWVSEDDSRKANFAWTQLKIINFYQFQKKSGRFDVDSKADLGKDNQKKKVLMREREAKSPFRVNFLFRPPLPEDKDKIFTPADRKIFDSLQSSISQIDTADKIAKYCQRLKTWEGNPFSGRSSYHSDERMHNHFEFNHFIGNKKALYYNLKQYYELMKKNVFQIIPLTFHIRAGAKDTEFNNFLIQFKRLEGLKHQNRKGKAKQAEKERIKNVWIIKPGQLSNRGNGIVVISQLKSFVNILKKQEKHFNGDAKTYIVQKYIERPLLYKGRKFDIRHYMIITRLHGMMRAYWYGQGYIRTASYQFDLDDVGDQMIHLTNDAVQKNGTFYGRHEEGNKLSYIEFQRYLDHYFPEEKISFADHIYPKMKAIATDAIKATYLKLDTNAFEHNFEIFGLDFMIDEKFKVWLIEVNTNPCLQLSSKLLARIIPTMLEQALRLSIDVIFPPPAHYPNSQKYLAPDNALGRLMYELIFDQAREGKQLIELYKGVRWIDYGGEVKQDDQTYQNEGKEIELGAELS